MLKKKENRYLFYLVFLTAITFYLLGIISLKSGLIRKAYDYFFALNYSTKDLEKFNASIKLDTIEIDFSKKKLKKIYQLRSDSFLSIKNYVNPNWQWIGERQWINAGVRQNRNDKQSAEIKLIGMNPDHFRDLGNLSFRIKNKNDYFLYGYEKYNIVNPYSRGFFVDYYYNQLFKKYGGLCIDHKPIITKFNNQFAFQLFEPFFSKDLIEFNNYRDGLILSLDKGDPEFLGHLKILHPSKIENLTNAQTKIYKHYDSIANNGNILNHFNINDLSFIIAVSIVNGGNTHHNTGFNLIFYADPVKGQLRPFLREVSVFDPLTANSKKYLDVKRGVYRSIGIDSNFQQFNILNDLVDKAFIYIKSNPPVQFLSNEKSTNIFTSTLLKGFFNARVYFDRIFYPIEGYPTFKNINESHKLQRIFKNEVFLEDTVMIIPANVELVFKSGLNLKMKNSALIVEGDVKTLNLGKNNINIAGDSLSTIIFKSHSVSLSNVNFIGFGNKINYLLQNYDVTSAITFVDSKLNLQNCNFSRNYSGDDMLNLIRCDFVLNNITVSRAKADALDIDAGIGVIRNSSFHNALNDGLDIGATKVQLFDITVFNCEDKGVSVGEKSSVTVEKFILRNNSIGIAIKDESDISIYTGDYEKNQVDLVAYGKKSKYNVSTIKQVKIGSSLKYLIEPDVIVNVEQPVNRTKNIINLMYGKVYGKASVR